MINRFFFVMNGMMVNTMARLLIIIINVTGVIKILLLVIIVSVRGIFLKMIFLLRLFVGIFKVMWWIFLEMIFLLRFFVVV